MCSMQAGHCQYLTEPEQMYHQQPWQQLHNRRQHMSSRPSLSPEKEFLMKSQGGGDSGLILSMNAKPRLKWTPELHKRFADAVSKLGGPDKATPKAIMRVMGIPGLILYHLKSHLQVHRSLGRICVARNLTSTSAPSGTSTMARPHSPPPSPRWQVLAEAGSAKAVAFDEIDKAPKEKAKRITIATVCPGCSTTRVRVPARPSLSALQLACPALEALLKQTEALAL